MCWVPLGLVPVWLCPAQEPPPPSPLPSPPTWGVQGPEGAETWAWQVPHVESGHGKDVVSCKCGSSEMEPGAGGPSLGGWER